MLIIILVRWYKRNKNGNNKLFITVPKEIESWNWDISNFEMKRWKIKLTLS